MASGHSRGLPIFHDDLNFHDRNERSFRDIQDGMDDGFGRSGFGRNWAGRNNWNWEDDLERMCADFHQLKPMKGPRMANLARDERGSRESLDGGSKSTYIEHPQTKSRTFHMSFDVKDYNPSDITVKAEGENLLVMARHEEDVGGHVNVREFSRKIKIPKDVDADKLTSTLSNDGILTVQAPVPPKYTSVAYVNPTKPITSNGSDVRNLDYKSQPRVSTQHSQPAPPPQQYQYAPPARKDPPVQPQQIQSSYTPPVQHSVQQRREPSPPLPPPPSQSSVSQTTAGQSDLPPPPTAAQLTSPPPLFEQPAFPSMPVDTPVFRDALDGNGREFELALEVARPFTPEDVVVKLEGMCLKVEATHVEKAQGKSSTTNMSRSFDLTEDLDPGSVDAMLRSDGCLLIKGKVKVKRAT